MSREDAEPLKGPIQLNSDTFLLYTHHPADGATDGIGLKLTIEAPSYLVDLQEEEQRVGKGRTSGALGETWSTEQCFHLNRGSI